MRSFWPVGEGAQADYEQLRAGALARTPLISAVAARFERSGLAGLIVAPSTTVIFGAVLLGAERPPWTPYADPRHDALADGYGLVLGVAGPDEAGLRPATSAEARTSSLRSAPS